MLSKERRLGEVVALRVKAKTNRALQADLTAAIEGAFKKHNIALDPEVKGDLVISIPDEIGDELNDVVLPGGTNC